MKILTTLFVRTNKNAKIKQKAEKKLSKDLLAENFQHFGISEMYYVQNVGYLRNARKNCPECEICNREKAYLFFKKAELASCILSKSFLALHKIVE